MTNAPAKDVLQFYLFRGRDALIWKLDGLSEYDIRHSLVATGTNLLGIVKHVAGVTAGSFGSCFGRPFAEPMPWLAEDTEPNSDMWATADESREYIVGLYHRAWAHAAATIVALDLDSVGHVSWWPPDRKNAPLGNVMTHMIAEMERHAGQADIIRELIDGSAGIRPGAAGIPDEDEAWWAAYREKVEQAAKQAAAT
jgi:hypothetical protein